MKICGIYLITSPTLQRYVGQSVDIYSRWYFYKKYFAENQFRLHNSLKKHGIENHKFEILEECSREMLNERESYWVKYYNTFNTDLGMNLTSGGDCPIMSNDTKEKLRLSSTGKRHTEETKQRLREINSKQVESEEARANRIKSIKRGKEHPLFGRKKSEETRKKLSKIGKSRPKPTKEYMEKMTAAAALVTRGKKYIRSEEAKRNYSKAAQGRVMKQETRYKIANGNRNKIVSEETKRNMSKAQIGNKKNLGKKASDEAKKNMSNAQKAYHAKKKTLKLMTIQLEQFNSTSNTISNHQITSIINRSYILKNWNELSNQISQLA